MAGAFSPNAFGKDTAFSSSAFSFGTGGTTTVVLVVTLPIYHIIQVCLILGLVPHLHAWFQ